MNNDALDEDSAAQLYGKNFEYGQLAAGFASSKGRVRSSQELKEALREDLARHDQSEGADSRNTI